MKKVTHQTITDKYLELTGGKLTETSDEESIDYSDIQVLSEKMSPEQAKTVVSNMKQGISKCATKYKGEPEKIKNCEERMRKIIAGIEKKYA